MISRMPSVFTRRKTTNQTFSPRLAARQSARPFHKRLQTTASKTNEPKIPAPTPMTPKSPKCMLFICRQYRPLERKGDPEVIGPDDKGEDALPEGEVEETDGKKPARKPQTAAKRVILDLYLLHIPKV